MKNEAAVSHSGAEGQFVSGIYLVCGLLMVLILLLDLAIPLGVAMGVPYIAVVLVSLWAPQKRFTVLVAVISSVFTIGAFFWKPSVVEMWKVIFYRSLALLAIWVTASLGLQRKMTEESREKVLREREKAIATTTVAVSAEPTPSTTHIPFTSTLRLASSLHIMASLDHPALAIPNDPAKVWRKPLH